MSDLDKLARQLKAAKKEHANAMTDHADAQAVLSECVKAVNDAAKALDEIRNQLMRAAEGGEPSYANYL